jgi:hypothetical protein
MSKTEDNTPLDGELKAYLAGEDGVSAAYRQAGAEEPPAELDRLILAAARDAVQKDIPRATATSRQKFSLAASFMVGVLVTSLYFNREDFTGSAVTSAELEEQAIIYQSVEQTAPAPAPATQAIAGDVQLEPLIQAAPQATGQLTDQLTSAIAPPERQETSQSKAEAALSSANSSALRVIVNNAIPPFRASMSRAPESNAATASRAEVTDDSEPDLSYRQTREEWLMAIFALREQAEQLANTNAQLGEEVELFSATYPDLDLDAELQALQAE